MVPNIVLKITFFILLGFILAVPLTAQNITHEVQDEETLFGIAQKYGVTVKQLQTWNDLSGNAISIGQTLIIKQQDTNSGDEEKGTYTVKDGDTLFSIAHQFGITVDELKEWNNLTAATIGIGQTLRIQPVEEPQPVKKPQSETTIEPVEEPVTVPAVAGTADGYYTVRSGDTLFRIAQLFGMEVEELKALNELESNNIHVGQELKIKGGSTRSVMMTAEPGAVIRYELKQGMGLNEFLKVFEMSKEKFKQLNPEMKATYLNKGQSVQVVVPKTDSEALSSSANAKLTVLGKANVAKYGSAKKGTVTTNGELYTPQALTAAHASMAIGSVIFVKNPANSRGMIVRINDRITEQGLKLSKAAWQALGLSGGQNRVILYRINE